MKWNFALEHELVIPQMNVNLILVGETRTGLPFCFEENFKLKSVEPPYLVLSLKFQAVNPLEILYQTGFIEISFRVKGILYYSLVELRHLEFKHNQCLLTLSVPEDLSVHQNRRFNRISLPAEMPLSCRIVGVRRNSTHRGIAFSGQILDISSGGLSFVTSTRIFYPLYLELSFSLPHTGQPFHLHGEIVRAVHFGNDLYRVAVEFRDMPEKAALIIEEYCSSF